MAPDEIQALDWALGALPAAEHAHAEARRLADPAFAALCHRWAEQLAPLAAEVEPVAPSAGLWNRIEAGITPASKPAPTAVAVAETHGGWWHSLGLWRGATATFAALALALVATRPPAPVAPSAPLPAPVPASLMAATLSSDTGKPLVTAALDRDRSAVVLSPVAAADLQGRVPELWLIPADGTPRSLGLISLGGQQQIVVSPTVLKLVAEGAVLAVSLEPSGGSPTGLPTGPVVATGKLSTL